MPQEDKEKCPHLACLVYHKNGLCRCDMKRVCSECKQEKVIDIQTTRLCNKPVTEEKKAEIAEEFDNELYHSQGKPCCFLKPCGCVCHIKNISKDKTIINGGQENTEEWENRVADFLLDNDISVNYPKLEGAFWKFIRPLLQSAREEAYKKGYIQCGLDSQQGKEEKTIIFKEDDPVAEIWVDKNNKVHAKGDFTEGARVFLDHVVEDLEARISQAKQETARDIVGMMLKHNFMSLELFTGIEKDKGLWLKKDDYIALINQIKKEYGIE